MNQELADKIQKVLDGPNSPYIDKRVLDGHEIELSYACGYGFPDVSMIDQGYGQEILIHKTLIKGKTELARFMALLVVMYQEMKDDE